MTAKEILALAQAHRSEPSLANYQALSDAVKAMERDRDDAMDDAECFRFWAHSAWSSPIDMARLLNSCNSTDEYRAKLLPIINSRKLVFQSIKDKA